MLSGSIGVIGGVRALIYEDGRAGSVEMDDVDATSLRDSVLEWLDLEFGEINRKRSESMSCFTAPILAAPCVGKKLVAAFEWSKVWRRAVNRSAISKR